MTDSVPIHSRNIEKCWEGRGWIWCCSGDNHAIVKLVNILKLMHVLFHTAGRSAVPIIITLMLCSNDPQAHAVF